MVRQVEPVNRVMWALVDWAKLPRRFAILVGSAVFALALAMAAVAVHFALGLDGGKWVSEGRVVNVADYRTEGRSDAAAIQAAIDAAGPGDTVYFPGGTYRLDRPFYFGSGVNHVGDPKTPAVLVGQGPTSLLIHHDPSRPLHDTTIRGLRFDNVELRLSGDQSYSAVVNVTLVDCTFENGRRGRPWESDYIWLSYTLGVTVDGCTFLRNSASGGRGVILERTRQSVIKDSYFGTTRDLEPGAPNGYFKTAINVTGYDGDRSHRNEDIFIYGNVLRRNSDISCPPAVPCEDHGIYAWGAKDLFIVDNYADGWSNTVSGGAVKVRNSEDVVISSNHFRTSGILAYTHWHSQPRYFNRVLISGNRIDLAGSGRRAEGISYRRADDPPGTNDYCTASGGEQDVHIVDNDFAGGGTINLRCADGRGFCVDNNKGARLTGDAAGLAASGCAPASSGDRPLAGIYRGDFNGDGREDFVHQVRNRHTNALHWRAHLSSGDGFRHADWGEALAVAGEKFGVHVGDFNGDGRDDIAYRGECGSGRCWRVQHSTDKGFTVPLDYGDGTGYTDDTLRFGVAVGDFNGDGRDDIAYRGVCEGTRPCWIVLTGRSDQRFAAEDWGDGVHWHPTQTDEYGLLVGDFNGDGRDDVAYRGSCAEGRSCWRVHLSEGNRFTPHDWGDGFSPDPSDAPHFAMRVGDANGDGKADLAYRGRCGDHGVRQWRYHLGGADGRFTISCSDTYNF